MTGSKEYFEDTREFELVETTRRFPASKTEIAKKANDAVETILDNDIALEIAEALSSMEKFVEAIRKDPRFLNAVIEKVNGKERTLRTGTKIELAETGVKYNYSNDQEWLELENEIKPLREKQKSREDFLKKIPAGKQLIDDDGTVIATGPAKSSISSFKVTLTK